MRILKVVFLLSGAAAAVPTLDPNPALPSAVNAAAVATETVTVTVTAREKGNENDQGHVLVHVHQHPHDHAQRQGHALPRLLQSLVIKKKNRVDKAAHPALIKLSQCYTSSCFGVLQTRTHKLSACFQHMKFLSRHFTDVNTPVVLFLWLEHWTPFLYSCLQSVR